MKYVLDKNGVVEYTEEQFEGIPECAFSTEYADIENGFSFVMSDDHVNFYLNHPEYDWRHLFTTSEYSEQELYNIKTAKNAEIEKRRESEYSSIADPFYMGYVKNTALGNDEKATEYYNKWLEAIQTIKEENPYIV